MNNLRIPLPSLDPRLKRHINHDPRSALYTLDTAGMGVTSVEWKSYIEVLDQGQIGKCTAMAATYVLGSAPFYATLEGKPYNYTDSWTNSFYSDEETLDGDGPYPPNDNGSSGLTSAKIAQKRGLISGYQHTFTTDDALKGLSLGPASWGTLWKTGMDDVNTDTGQVKYSGQVRGGHEMCLYKVDVANEQVWFRQSWGAWGYRNQGLGWISFDDFDKSLAEQGDVTFFVPLSKPAPTPTPAPTPSSDANVLAFYNAAVDWAHARHTGANKTAATAAKTLFAAEGLS